jgi:hypothetical protein
MRQQSSPAKAGDSLLQSRQPQAWAKAFVWATSNGVRECAPDNGLRAPVTHADLLDEMADAAP